MEAVGIGDRTYVVAYAETDHSGAARLWWALRFYGHNQVAVLNGGWTKWVAEGPFKYRFFRAVRQQFAPVLSPDVSAFVCVRAYGVGKSGAVCWEP